MYSVYIHYTDGKMKEFKNIHTIKYISSDTKTISGDELLTKPLPLSKPLYLLSDTSNIAVSNANVSAIEIEKL